MLINQNNIRIVLVNAVSDGDYQYEQEIPLGLATVGAFLRHHGYEVIFKQCFVSRGDEQIESVSGIEADIYGFQLNMVNYPSVRAIAEKIKKGRPDAMVVLGGPFLVSLSEQILKCEPLYDFIVMGEGEYTSLELVQAIERKEEDFSAIKGIAWRDKSGVIRRNEARPLIDDLDEIPFPARDLLESARRDPKDNCIMESIRIITSRGCISRCTFCCVNFYNKVQKGKVWRGRSPVNVVDELELLSKTYGARLFNFSDSSFEDPGKHGKVRSREICEEIIRRKLNVSIKIYMRCETMKTEEDKELLALYKRAGIDVVIIGAESGSDYELKIYGKNATLEDNSNTLSMLRGLDLFYVFAGFIMFGPYSTTETLKTNIDFLAKWGFADNLYILSNTLMLIKDSKLYSVLQSEGRVIESERFWELPKYNFTDPLVDRTARHWQNIINQFPVTKKLNTIQINAANLISRMTNPMNAEVLQAVNDEYLKFKSKYQFLSGEFGKIQADYFRETINLIIKDSSDEILQKSKEDFFNGVYTYYLPEYDNLYKGFLDKIINEGFSLSGLVFEHFYSSVTVKYTERI